MRTLVGAAVLVLAAAGPAGAVDADRRTGPDRHQVPGVGRPLLADLVPDTHCLRVRTIPASTGRDLLYLPCQDDVVLPPPAPRGDRPPVIIPVTPPR